MGQKVKILVVLHYICGIDIVQEAEKINYEKKDGVGVNKRTALNIVEAKIVIVVLVL